MELNIDLNNLSLDELKVVVKLAEKGSKGEEVSNRVPKEEPKEVPEGVLKRKYRRRKGNNFQDFVEEKFNEIVGYVRKQKEPIGISKVMRKFKIPQNGPRTAYIKDKLLKVEGIEAVGKRKVVSTLPKPKKSYSPEFLSRQSFVLKRASAMMKQDKFLNREQAVKRAYAEFGGRKEIKVNYFDWETLSEQGERIKELLSQRFREGKSVNQLDFNFLAYTDINLYQFLLVKIAKNKEDILKDLELKGDIVIENGRLQYRKG